MSRLAACLCLVVALHFLSSASNAPAQAVAADEFVSEASRIVATFKPKVEERTPEARAEAARKFIDTLDEGQKKRVSLQLDDPERRKWTNLPAAEDAGGLRLGNCEPQQVEAFCQMMATLLSEQGYAKMCNIMLADDQLIKGGRARPGLGTEYFAVVLFGEPSATKPWGFQLDGHHVGFNLAIEGEKLTMSPSFIGTQPEAFHLADKKVRPLAGEIDGAFALINSLDAELQKQAIVDPKRGNLRSGPGTDGQVPEPLGVSCAGFTEAQQESLLKLIAQWVNDLPPDQAKLRMEQLREEVDQMHFAWHGPTKLKSDVSYAIQGPSLIIEYTCQDLGGNPPDHLHTMYRDPTNEYGKQLK